MWGKDDRSMFERVAQSPDSWLSIAYLLKRAADLVKVELRPIIESAATDRQPYHDLMLSHPFMMLNGFAIENLIKGILFGRKPEMASNGKLNCGSHNLKGLSSEAGISLTTSEIDLLERLTIFTVWAGRYPTALKEENNTSPHFNTTDLQEVDELYERLFQMLINENPNPTIHFSD